MMEFTPDFFLENYFAVEKPLDQLSFDSEYSPFDYLEFAKEDLKAGAEVRNIINAIGNAKRALHLQVETICIGYGYKEKRKDFPPKLIFLKDLGIVAPRVLEKLNKIRNRIEHDYYSPTLDETNDFIDIVELFIYATINFVAVFPDKTIFYLGEDVYELHDEAGFPAKLEVNLVKNFGKLTIYDPHEFEDKEPELLVSAQVGQSEYFAWVRKLFAQLFYLPL